MATMSTPEIIVRLVVGIALILLALFIAGCGVYSFVLLFRRGRNLRQKGLL